MIVKKRVKQDPIVVEVNGVKFAFRYPDPYDRVNIFSCQGDVGEICRYSLKLLEKIEPEVKFEDGTVLTPQNFGELADEELVMEVAGIWLNRYASDRVKLKQQAEAEEKKAFGASPAESEGDSSSSSENQDTPVTSTSESSETESSLTA